jgi:hypothetical protein
MLHDSIFKISAEVYVKTLMPILFKFIILPLLYDQSIDRNCCRSPLEILPLRPKY